jgi:hypothetical protein
MQENYEDNFVGQVAEHQKRGGCFAATASLYSKAMDITPFLLLLTQEQAHEP